MSAIFFQFFKRINSLFVFLLSSRRYYLLPKKIMKMVGLLSVRSSYFSFFLSPFLPSLLPSILEVSFITRCPKFLYSLSTGNNAITYSACAIQFFFGFLIGATEFFLLASMSYDCCAAICKPLQYMTVMNNKVCALIVLSCWVTGFF